jgi:protein phosphatase
LLGGWLYVRSQYYVGPAHGKAAVYRGVAGSVGPIKLASVVDTGPDLSTLQPETRRQVSQHISADSRAAAERILQQVASNTLPGTGDGPAPSLSSSPAPTTGTTAPVSPPPTTAGTAVSGSPPGRDAVGAALWVLP